MGRYFKYAFAVIWSICTLNIQLPAQSLQQAESDYMQFVGMTNSGADKNARNTVLYRCYTGYSNILCNQTPDNATESLATERLCSLRPYLQSAAISYSQNGMQREALRFAKAFVDISLLPGISRSRLTFDDYYPTMVYFAASGTYNSGDFAGAIKYFEEYLRTGAGNNRKDVYMFMAKACSDTGDHRKAATVLENAMSEYPSDFNLLSMAINNSIDGKDDTTLQQLLNRALAIKPSDVTLLNIQGKLYEDTGDYAKAAEVYGELRRMRPRSLDVAKHLALNYYNMGILLNNKSVMEDNRSLASGYMSRSQEYFSAAIPVMRSILDTDPASLKYSSALANAYMMTGDNAGLSDMNRKITALGGSNVSVGSIPALISFDDRQSPAPVQSPGVWRPAEPGKSGTPAFSTYAQKYVSDKIATWQKKDQFETVDEYMERVTEENRDAKAKELIKEAEKSYLSKYAQNLDLDDIHLLPYDAENEAFLADSPYGKLIIPVPRAGGEAQIFESSWNGIQFRNPEFAISDDRIMLSSLDFVTPAGKIYRYDNSMNLSYTETHVDLQFNDIDYGTFAAKDGTPTGGSRISRKNISIGKSDVDTDIPECPEENDDTYALIIANENYEMAADVPMAINDGKVFSEYCTKTLGLPQSNVRYYEDATFGTFMMAMRDIKNIASVNRPGDFNLIFYYAGHGMPDESTKDAFLLPVDADGMQTEVCYPLRRLYSELGNLGAGSVLVFLDACFSGASRDGGMVASSATRGIALKAKDEAPQGNMVIFSAASGQETALPYEEKGHGLFTYYLLKKLQVTQGNVTLKELGEYISENVRKQSVVINRKSQTPSVMPAASMSGQWEKLTLK